MGMSLRIHSIDLYYGILNINLLARFRVYQILLSVREGGGLVDYGYATTNVSGNIYTGAIQRVCSLLSYVTII